MEAKMERRRIRKELRQAQSQFYDFEKLNLFKTDRLAQLRKDKPMADSNQGIYLKIKENGTNLSLGERQLVCICRAILRKNKIVILDEATSSIDIVTEKKIEIMDNFSKQIKQKLAG